MPFTDLGIITDQGTLQDNAVANLQALVPGYVPNAANLEVIMIDVLAPMAAEQAAVASVVPSAILRTYGSKLVGVAYQAGVAASAAITVNLSDTLGHTVPAGTPLTIAGLGFTVQADIVVAAGANSGTGVAIAAETGVAYNGVSTPAYLVNSFDWVSSVTVTAASANGQDPEDDQHYQDRLTGLLQLQAPRPITAADYQTFVLSFPPASGQQTVGRATSIDGYNPAATAFTATTTNASTTLSVVSSFTGITVGSIITGTGIPTNTTVSSVNVGASTLVMSNAATASAAGVALTSTGTYGNSRTVGVWIAAADGTALSGATLTAVQTWLAGFRELNFVINVMSPTYTPVYATVAAKLYTGFDPAATAAAIQTAVMAYLSPAQFGNPQAGNAAAWANDTAVRYNKLIGIVEQVAGVNYVTSLTIGLSASPTGTTDLVLPGPAPLPTSTTTTVPLPTVT